MLVDEGELEVFMSARPISFAVFFVVSLWGASLHGPVVAQSQTVMQGAANTALNLETDALFFRSGSTQLMPESATRLEALAAVLQTSMMSDTCLKLVGHSDTVGAEQANMNVSKKRAEYVREKLRKMLPATAHPIEVDAMGEAEPLPDMAGTDPRNRRVVIWAKKCGG